MGVALLKQAEKEGEPPEIIYSRTFRRIGHTLQDIRRFGRMINSDIIRNKDLEWKDIDVIIEGPAPRYYGRANQFAILKIWWQVYQLLAYFYKKAGSIEVVDSYNWNVKVKPNGLTGQYNDDEKLKIFKNKFPSFRKNVPEQQAWGTKDVRDAILMGCWYYKNNDSL